MKHLMLLLLSVFLCAGLGNTLVAQDTAPKTKKTKKVKKSKKMEAVVPAKPGAQMTFEKPKHNFGILQEGPKVNTFFNFVNDGSEPLIIESAKGSCGCTVPKYPKEPIMPGESAEIEVTYNTKGRIGNFNKSVTFKTNVKDEEGLAKPIRIYITGKVEKAK